MSPFGSLVYIACLLAEHRTRTQGTSLVLHEGAELEGSGSQFDATRGGWLRYACLSREEPRIHRPAMGRQRLRDHRNRMGLGVGHLDP